VATGTSLRDLMARMGHDSPAAALIYQHVISRADQKIAKALGAAMTADVGQVDDQEA
jgi:chemotaxis response regulator CheB